VKSEKDLSPVILRTRAAMQAQARAWRKTGEVIGFVPTMGALHDGHLSLLHTAKAQASKCVVSVFVNPAQFAPGEDFERYPRDEAKDLELLAAAGCDAVYLPDIEEIYPRGNLTAVSVTDLSDRLEGRCRPHFFYGVSTVVARLFLHVLPDIAVFGEKDYQQLQIIRRMVRDLGFPIEIIGGPTQRESDGLAQSSRNAYLSPEERQAAGAVFSALHRASVRLKLGAAVEDALAEAEAHLKAAGFGPVDYFSAVDPDTFEDISSGPLASGQTARLLVAAWLGRTRLIDNLSASA
jgi:pantoate--beta-alanine ligase